MNDTHKLLLAFIEASGFDVETTPRIIETPENLLVKTMLVTDYKVTKKEKPPMTMAEAKEFLRDFDKHQCGILPPGTN